MAEKPTDQKQEFLQEGLTQRYVSLRKRRKKKATTQPPLTPMIDVTFQLLIYFIVTATFRQAEGQIPGSLPADLGQVQQKVTVEPMRVVLMPGLTDDRAVQYRIDGSQPTDSPAVLYDRLQARKEVTPDPTLVIAAHPRVRWEYVVEAFNQAVRAAYEKISFQVAR